MATGGKAEGLKAVVIGATGATGRHLVGYLMKHKDIVSKVSILGRKKLEVSASVHCSSMIFSMMYRIEGPEIPYSNDIFFISDIFFKC